jgi:hypothetical protein
MRKRVSRRKSPGSGNDLRPEYDFSGGVRGKHAARYAAGTNVVVLEPDVAAAFPNSAVVNEALRALAPLIRRPRRARPHLRKSA